MRNRRTQQLLPHTHFREQISCARSGPPVHVRKWKWMSNTPQGGQRSARLHSGTLLCRLHSRRVVLLSHCSHQQCFCWGNTALSFRLIAASEGGCVSFSVSLCLLIPAGSLPTVCLSCGRKNPPDQNTRCRFSALRSGFHFRPLKKHCTSSQIWIIWVVNHNYSPLSSQFLLFQPFQCIKLLVSSDYITIFGHVLSSKD